MRCAHCGARFDPGDSFCRRCGEPVDGQALATVVSRSLLPVPWTVAKGPVMRGLAALIVGTAVELLRRHAEKRSHTPAPADPLALLAGGNPMPPERRRRFPWSRAPKGEYEVTETIIQRRIWFKR